jgi:hypothetical protein
MHRKVARAAVMALVLTFAVGVAGCGGDEAPTRAEFVKQADAMCKRSKRGFTAEDQSNAVQFARGLIERQRELIADLDALEPPEELAARVNRYLGALRTSADLSEQLVNEVDPEADGSVPVSGKAGAVAKQRSKASHEAADLAKEIGLKACGS